MRTASTSGEAPRGGTEIVSSGLGHPRCGTWLQRPRADGYDGLEQWFSPQVTPSPGDAGHCLGTHVGVTPGGVLLTCSGLGAGASPPLGNAQP